MELVYYKGLKAEPYTTAEVIAEFSGVDLDSINRLTRTHKERLEKFGKVGFEIRAMASGQKQKVWKYNERQATVLITYLRNTPKVLDFKDSLVNAFYSMKQELDQAKLSREINKRANIGLADTIKAELPNDPHAYSNYHQLAYKYATGLTPKQLKKAKGVNKPEEALDNDQKERLERAKQHIALYILDGNDYQDIKAKLFADI
ncbi:Rha family transcriptional regulator [uncultured Fructobacillus sp.]|uniref:Rha family transcriptional regulator n=1 Tax=uncultured Fructobacillus sp. TaxID=591942 RepID=UPI0025969F66|nr:Rha family transcriptional regulator [uncultured Fructobacillus sp.]